jgi:hypothetical protein
MQTKPYITDPAKEAILEESILVAESVLALKVSEETRRRVFDSTTWFVSERYGKYSTRYRSVNAMTQSEGLRHDHVFPRRDLWFIARRAATVREALSLCVGCIVTGDEHRRLGAAEKTNPESQGWLRYIIAGIEVIDCTTGKKVPSDVLESMSESFIRLYRASRFMAAPDDFGFDGEKQSKQVP